MDSLCERKVATAGDVGNAGMTDIETISEGDILQVRVSSDKSAAVTISHMNLNIVQIN